MVLTAEQFDQIVASLRSDAPGLNPSEKRECPRVGIRAQIEIVPFVAGATPRRYRVWMRDISTSGIGFIHSHPIKPGTALIVCLRKGRSDMLKLLYKVVRVERIDDNQYGVGAMLERALDDASAALSPQAN